MEVGASSGAFIHLANCEFDSVVAVEPDPQSCQYIKSKGIQAYSSIDLIPTDQKYDLIVLFHVLEHIAEPVALLDKMVTYLTDKGSILIEVPNVEDILISHYDIPKFKDFYFCSPHLFYFSEKTLTQLLNKVTNLKITNIEFIQRYDLKNHLKWLNNQNGCNFNESNFSILSEITLAEYNKDLIRSKKTDTIRLLCSLKN